MGIMSRIWLVEYMALIFVNGDMLEKMQCWLSRFDLVWLTVDAMDMG